MNNGEIAAYIFDAVFWIAVLIMVFGWNRL